jgi:hypothetical protein
MKAFEEAKEILEGFTLDEAERIISVYACSQCEGGLAMIPSEWDMDIWLVICPDCGNVEQIGRISKTTVAIRNERGVFDFPKAVRALPEFWGELIKDKNTALKELGF